MLIDPAALAQPDEDAAAAVLDRASRVLRPNGALKALDDLAVWLAAWQRNSRPRVETVKVVVFGGDHGVAHEGVSAYPASVTVAMVEAIQSGVATVSAMADAVGATIEVIPLGLGEIRSGNIRVEPALTPEEFDDAFQAGRDSVGTGEGLDLLIPGEVGIGNTTAASAVSHALFDGIVSDWVGHGTGLDSEGMERKKRVVEEAVARVETDDPLEILRELGGWELAAMAGAVYQARVSSVPVLLDGFVVAASVMPLELAHAGLLDHCWPGHVSAERGHRLLVQELRRHPILDLGLRLGEASGALAALPIVRIAARSVTDVATFEEIGLL